MIHLKQQSTVMQHLFKKIFLILLFLFILSGCKENDNIKTGEWLASLSYQTGLSDEGESYEQALKNWGIDIDELNLDDDLTKEDIAFVFDEWLMLDDVNIDFKDKDECSFLNQVQSVVHFGLMKVNDDEFKPKQKVSKLESMNYISDLLFVINDETFDDKFDVTMKENMNLKEVTPYLFNKENLTAIFHIQDNVHKNDIVKWVDDETHLYQVIDVVDGVAILKQCEFDQFQKIEIGGELELDFDNVEFEFYNNESTSFYQNNYEFCSTNNNEFEFNDFTIRYNYSFSSLSFYVFKKTNLDATAFAELNINDFNPVFKWKSDGLNIEHAFFKIEFDTLLSSGLKKGNYHLLNLNFNKLDKDNFFDSLNHAWSNQRSSVDTAIPLAKIKIPVTNIPTLYIVMDLSIRLYLNGTVELLCTMDNSHGFEIRNNQLRSINDLKEDIDFHIQASSGVSSKITVSANVFNQDIADISFTGGIKALVSSTIHFPEKNEFIDVSTVPYDVLDELVLRDQGFTVCGDLKAHWDASLGLNSLSTLAGKMGLGKSIDILHEKNAPLFNGATKHIENMQFVNICTRQSYGYKPIVTLDTTTDRIVLENYSMIVYIDEPRFIKIRGLPNGTALTDLSFSSSDESIVTVDNKGLVTGIKQGTARVKIVINGEDDGIMCNILVK